MPTVKVHPCWAHAHKELTHLVEALQAHPTFADVADPSKQQHWDNAGYMWDFCKRMRTKLEFIQPDLPPSSRDQWDDFVNQCMWIDGAINNPEDNLNHITGQYPLAFEFKAEEKAAAKQLALGLLELDDDATGGF